MERLDDHHDMVYYQLDLDPVWNVMGDAFGVLAFDIGANIGQSTRVLAENFDKVIAFEPCRESFEILEAEMPANVTALQLAVSSGPQAVQLFESDTHTRFGELVSQEVVAGVPVGQMRAVKVPATTIDFQTKRWGDPSFVKIDVEGHELEVIAGGFQTFRSIHPRVLIEVHDKHYEGAIYNLLEDYTFTKHEHPINVRQSIRENHFWLASI